MEREADRSKQSQMHLERTHQARERAHKQRVRGLEEQVFYQRALKCGCMRVFISRYSNVFQPSDQFCWSRVCISIFSAFRTPLISYVGNDGSFFANLVCRKTFLIIYYIFP